MQADRARNETFLVKVNGTETGKETPCKSARETGDRKNLNQDGSPGKEEGY